MGAKLAVSPRSVAKFKTKKGATARTVQRGVTARSVLRATQIFDLIASRGVAVTINDISRALTIPRTTVYEIVRTLIATELIEAARTTPGRYQLGNKLYRLGMAYRRQVDLLREAAPIVEALRDEVDETVQLSVLDKGMVLVLLKENSRQPIAIVSEIGSRLPVNWSASGRLLVSDMTDALLRDKLPTMLKRSPTGKATLDIATFISEVRAARARGYDIQVSQASPHTGAVAAPVIAASGRCVATISLVIPAHKFIPDMRREVAQVKQAAAALSARLGGG